MADASGLRLRGALLSLALAGCATPIVYGPLAAGNGFGYGDFPNADGSHTVLTIGASAEQAHAFWDQRAAEICGGAAYRKNIFRAQRPIVSGTGYASNAYNPSYGTTYTYDMYGTFNLEGYLRCEGPAAVVEAATGAPAPEVPANPEPPPATP